jgi:hypothetical protein
MEFKTRFNLGDEVYVLQAKSALQRQVRGIRVTQRYPYILYDGKNGIEKSGIEIDYLIELPQTVSCRTDFDYYKEEDVFISKDELLNRIV